MPPRVVAVVVSHNTADLLREALTALAGTETWVVDNASTDASASVVRAEFPAVHLLERPDNPGYGAGVNLGADAAGDWDWLVVANADTAPAPGAIEALIAAGTADPGAGALAPRLVGADGAPQHSAHDFWGVRFALGFALQLERHRPGWAERNCVEGYWDPGRSRRVPWAIGAFLVIRRAAWDAAGGFDPAQWLYAEDLDLGWRMARAGWATRHVAEAVVRHAGSASTGPLWGDARTAYWMAASYDWMLRRRGTLRTRVTAAINIAGALARREPGWARLHALGLLPRRRLRARLPRPASASTRAGGA